MEDFLIKAFLAGIGISIATSLIGVFILWKRMAYFGDAIAHSSVLGLGLSLALAWQPIFGMIIFALIFAFLINSLDRDQFYSKDTIIGIVSYSALAVGLLLIAVFPRIINLNSYLFGDIVVVSNKELVLIYVSAFLTILATIFWFNKLLLTTISTELALVEGIKVNLIKVKFLFLTALVIAVSVKIVGIFLITAMLILPAAIARNFSQTPKQMVFITLIFSIIANCCGILISLFYDLPASSSIIAVLATLFLISFILRKSYEAR